MKVAPVGRAAPRPAPRRGLAAALAEVGRQSARNGAPAGMLSASVPVQRFDPIALYQAAVEAGLEAVVWIRPGDEFALVGIGRAWAVEAAGPGRFDEAAAAIEALCGTIRTSHSGGVRALGPVIVGGLGFAGRPPGDGAEWAPFGASSMVLPELTALAAPSGAWVTGSVPAGGLARAAELEAEWNGLEARSRELAAQPEADATAQLTVVTENPARGRWNHVVGLMAGAVGRGRLDKVVFARRLDLESTEPLDVPAALRRLAASAPESTIYAFHRAGSVFMGATPERLVRTDGMAYRTVAIAGSMRRGADPVEDAALAAELMASEKEREEHAVVVRTIRHQLAPISERIEVAATPSVLRLRHVQHLMTEISGTVRSRTGLLALAGLLHPTPAVGGEPRDLALAMIGQHEGFDRGWYAGPIGWLSPDGDGELMVALRCGLVRGGKVSLFAGCGIVADSDPDREWEESRIKMRTMAAALGQTEGAL